MEVAGLLLGAIPIMISALEQYQKTITFFEQAVHKKRHIDRLIVALRQQEALFMTEIELMLRNAGRDKEELIKVLSAPELRVRSVKDLYLRRHWLTESWAKMNSHDLYRTLQDRTLENEMQERLGRNYRPYVDAIDDCHRAIADIARNVRGFLPKSEYQPVCQLYLVPAVWR